MTSRSDARDRMLDAADALLRAGGREAVTTRAVAEAAGVQAPAIYRQFGDMQGLLGAVAARAFEGYLAQKRAQRLSDDPLADLRTGWDLHVNYGLEHPHHYLLTYADPHPGHSSEVTAAAHARLLMLTTRVAEVGSLRVSPETASGMIEAAGTGVTLRLIGQAVADRDPAISHRVRDAVFAGITTADAVVGATASTAPTGAAHAAALLAGLSRLGEVLTPGERMLLAEMLERIADASSQESLAG
ncbi:TetR/AcrR family transcriptional regulator [Leucobacter musarum]|uniref:TetR/AcrR family transcriptional regulator n=1 Tax=Leucobacter musarum TaxID=1930747 RepID=UPI0006A7ABD7|nr:TetR/AcrR family transcriptional regulator [Leucobacter musarum]